ncbi:MAG: GDSL-type esterase/lipase family protein [Ferruginibacter sp.]
MARLIFITVSILVTLLSCTKDDHLVMTTTIPNTPPTPTVPDTSSARSFLALGDSYTIGQSVNEADRFPVQAARSLTAAGIKFGAPEIIARTGWTTADLLNAIAVSPPTQPSYDIVTLLIGVNNQHQQKTQEEYAAQFLTLLNMAVHYAGDNRNRVVVLSIPDYSVTPYAQGSDKALIAKEIDSFNLINKSIALKNGVNYLDITASSRLAANDASLIASDGLHPSRIEYKVWADALVPVIKLALQ